MQQMDEASRLRLLERVRDGEISVDEAVVSIAGGMRAGRKRSCASVPLPDGKDVHAAVMGAVGSAGWPPWLNMAMVQEEFQCNRESIKASDEQVSELEKKVSESERMRATDTAGVQAAHQEQVGLLEAMLEVERVSNQHALARAAAGEQAVAQLKVQLETRQRLHDQVRQQYSTQQRAMQEIEFELECTSMRVESLQNSLSRAKEDNTADQSKVAVMDALQEVLAKKGVDIESLAPEAQVERLTDLLEGLSKHEIFASVRSAMGDAESRLEPFLEQLNAGKDPEELFEEMIEDGTLAAVVTSLAASGVFGPKVKAMAEDGRIAELTARATSPEAREMLGKLMQVALTVATAPASKRMEVLTGEQVAGDLTEITRAGGFGTTVQNIVASGKVKRLSYTLRSCKACRTTHTQTRTNERARVYICVCVCVCGGGVQGEGEKGSEKEF